MKQLEVQIMGQSYLLNCPEGGEAQLLSAVERVDTAMCKIRDAGKIKARDRIAVLAALNLVLDLPQAPHTTANAASTSSQTASHDAKQAPPEDTLNALLSRLDQALSGDGHLI